jgi:hypothetical protein
MELTYASSSCFSKTVLMDFSILPQLSLYALPTPFFWAA